MGNFDFYNYHIRKNIYRKDFIQFPVPMELYGIVWQEVSHTWKLYDKKFWSTREYSIVNYPASDRKIWTKNLGYTKKTEWF